MKYCWRNMKCLSDMKWLCHEVKFALMCEAHFIVSTTSYTAGVLHLPQANFIEKSTCFCKCFFLVPLTGSRESRCCRRRAVGRRMSTGHPHFYRSSPTALKCKKGTSLKGCSFFGAADRTRTGTELPPADFKSAVSTIPPQRRGLPNHFSTVSDCRQVGRTALPPPIRSGDCPGWLSWLVGGVGDPALQRNQNNSLHVSSAEAMTASIS